MTQSKAFSIAHLLLSHNLQAKLYRSTDGLWHVEANTKCDKYVELFGEER